jgi:nicotinamide-nucleotide amidase
MTETLSPTLPADVEEQVERVLKSACDKRLTFVTAESCTGGLLASLLTDVDGCAHAFERGFVTYTDAAKVQQLDVPRELLKFHSAVSAPVAEAMARGALARSEGDIALAVTGFAGRGAPYEESGAGLLRHRASRWRRPGQGGPLRRYRARRRARGVPAPST